MLTGIMCVIELAGDRTGEIVIEYSSILLFWSRQGMSPHANIMVVMVTPTTLNDVKELGASINRRKEGGGGGINRTKLTGNVEALQKSYYNHQLHVWK